MAMFSELSFGTKVVIGLGLLALTVILVVLVWQASKSTEEDDGRKPMPEGGFKTVTFTREITDAEKTEGKVRLLDTSLGTNHKYLGNLSNRKARITEVVTNDKCNQIKRTLEWSFRTLNKGNQQTPNDIKETYKKNVKIMFSEMLDNFHESDYDHESAEIFFKEIKSNAKFEKLPLGSIVQGGLKGLDRSFTDLIKFDDEESGDTLWAKLYDKDIEWKIVHKHTINTKDKNLKSKGSCNIGFAGKQGYDVEISKEYNGSQTGISSNSVSTFTAAGPFAHVFETSQVLRVSEIVCHDRCDIMKRIYDLTFSTGKVSNDNAAVTNDIELTVPNFLPEEILGQEILGTTSFQIYYRTATTEFTLLDSNYKCKFLGAPENSSSGTAAVAPEIKFVVEKLGDTGWFKPGTKYEWRFVATAEYPYLTEENCDITYSRMENNFISR